MDNGLQVKTLQTDVLIIGGGTAGCYAAYVLGQNQNHQVMIAEKANIKRSGCLAAGVNAINAYITQGRVPMDYVNYAKQDAKGIVREDLLLSMAEGLNEVTKVLEDNGLVILKDDQGNYVTRGNRNIKINGENIKPILAEMAAQQGNVTVLNHVNITDYIVENNQILGAVGFSVDEREAYVIRAKAVLVATGGAAGLYRPNNPGFSRHKMWYPPFNTGAGYAMGIRSGAEMTTFEMRFIALRCKDTIAPTGTIAQGVQAKQMNGAGEIYEKKYGIATCERVYGTTKEKQEGRGPCYLKTDEITREQEEDLYKAYLNMAPAQTLRWLENGSGPATENVEIEGTEPYIVGGHTASGYWIDNHRATTIKGLYAAGDVAGGAPQKYVTGALVEGKIAGESIQHFLQTQERELCSQGSGQEDLEQIFTEQARQYIDEYEKFFHNSTSFITIEQAEETMQGIMDTYAGGIGSNYQFNETELKLAKEKLKNLIPVVEGLQAGDMDELLQIYEIRERLTVCFSVIEHLMARKETRWHSFAENMDYPKESEDFKKYVNSCYKNGEIQILLRELVDADHSLEFSFDGDNKLKIGGVAQ
ncbi:MAG: adenylyl-sulfate reductase subunit alpha [Lachnospiraceae bacterium]|nr:adenylyl-sulfate reductase subunit alpha [Lachnospiraceae bacterium]